MRKLPDGSYLTYDGLVAQYDAVVAQNLKLLPGHPLYLPKHLEPRRWL